MIRIIEGAPGSGKSYFMVKYLSHFFTYDSFYDEFILKDNVLIISNIEGLRVKHLQLDELLKRFPLEQFFTVENFEKIISKYKANNIILLIDEAQKYFDRKFYDKDVFYFFQYHRHLGVDVILGTQGANLVANAFIPLCEYIVEARPRSKAMIGNFTYFFKDQKGKFLYSKVLRKDQVIFKAYQSFVADEVSKPKNVILHWCVFGGVLILTGLFLFKSALAIVKNKSEKGKPAVVSKKAPVQVGYTSNKVSTASFKSMSSPKRVPIVVEEIKPEWVVVPVDGYVQLGSRRVICALGQYQRVFRNFNNLTMTAEIPYLASIRSDIVKSYSPSKSFPVGPVFKNNTSH